MTHFALVGQRPEVVIYLVLAERGNRQRPHKVLRRGGHDAANRGAALAQPADQVQALIGGNPAGDDEQNAPILKHGGSPILSTEVNMLLPGGEGESYRYRPNRSATAIPAKANAVIHNGTITIVRWRARWAA